MKWWGTKGRASVHKGREKMRRLVGRELTWVRGQLSSPLLFVLPELVALTGLLREAESQGEHNTKLFPRMWLSFEKIHWEGDEQDFGWQREHTLFGAMSKHEDQ